MTTTISGAISGLDTASLINSLVSAESNQQTLLKRQQTAAQNLATAYSTLSSSLSTLGSLAGDLAKTSTWAGASATSSSGSVTATATGTTNTSLTFDVTAVATAHSLISSTFSSTADQAAASGSLTLTKDDGTETTIDVGSGSLADVVSGINSANAGVRAAAVRSGPGEYRLQITSSSTGAASAFTVSGLIDDPSVLTAGSDAEVTIGDPAGTGFAVRSASNTFADLAPGLSFTVSKLETGVTVTSKVDGTQVADQVSKLVGQVNSILSDISTKTAYDTAKKTGGVFTGQGPVRSLQQNLLDAVSLSGAPGVSLTRDGKLSFDKDAFLTAFRADPSSVAAAYGARSTFTPSSGATSSTATVTNALKTSRAGSYDIAVSQAATRESWTLEFAGGVGTGQAVSLTRGDSTVSYTPVAGESLADAAKALNERLSGAGFGVTAAVNGNLLVLSSDGPGSASAFSASLGGVAGVQVTAGKNVAGTIDGQEATGLGAYLTLSSSSGGVGGAVGLTVEISTTSADLAATGGALGTLAFTPGLAQRLSTLVSDATGNGGSLTTAQSSSTGTVKRFQEQIDDWDRRLAAYRQSLTTQFTAMETALAKLKSATSAITNLLATDSSTTSSSN